MDRDLEDTATAAAMTSTPPPIDFDFALRLCPQPHVPYSFYVFWTCKSSGKSNNSLSGLELEGHLPRSYKTKVVVKVL